MGKAKTTQSRYRATETVPGSTYAEEDTIKHNGNFSNLSITMLALESEPTYICRVAWIIENIKSGGDAVFLLKYFGTKVSHCDKV